MTPTNATVYSLTSPEDPRPMTLSNVIKAAVAGFDLRWLAHHIFPREVAWEYCEKIAPYCEAAAKQCADAWIACIRKIGPAYTNYDRVSHEAQTPFRGWDDYESKAGPAWEACSKNHAEALAKYKEQSSRSMAGCNEMCGRVFWKLLTTKMSIR